MAISSHYHLPSTRVALRQTPGIFSRGGREFNFNKAKLLHSRCHSFLLSQAQFIDERAVPNLQADEHLEPI
jgi:hypothetical protein